MEGKNHVCSRGGGIAESFRSRQRTPRHKHRPCLIHSISHATESAHTHTLHYIDTYYTHTNSPSLRLRFVGADSAVKKKMCILLLPTVQRHGFRLTGDSKMPIGVNVCLYVSGVQGQYRLKLTNSRTEDLHFWTRFILNHLRNKRNMTIDLIDSSENQVLFCQTKRSDWIETNQMPEP